MSDEQWVEFYGGPDDGQMEELPPWTFAYTGLPVFEYVNGINGGHILGRYRPAGLAIEGLQVLTLRWQQGERLRTA